MDLSRLRGSKDWPFEIPPITAEVIDAFVAAMQRRDRNMSEYHDDLDGGTREMSDESNETIIREYYLYGGWRRELADGQAV